MMKIVRLVISTCIFLSASSMVFGQTFKPGFDKSEYTELIKIAVTQVDTVLYKAKISKPAHSRLIYRSASVGLDNSWDLWMYNNEIAVISIRATTVRAISWTENFYAAMLPAKGVLPLTDSTRFIYKLAVNEQAAVHAGWLTGLAYMSGDILAKMDSCVQKGITQFFITGHSQGGAISILLTAYLKNLIKENHFAKQITLKTYSSASPKPGNLYFAYDYEYQTYGGWAFTIINSADWVPETPLTIQTKNDFNKTNAFNNVDNVIRKQHFPNNIIFRYGFNQLDKPLRKAQRKNEKYLGRLIYKRVKKPLNNEPQPAFVHSANYMRCGEQVILLADDSYYKLFPDNPKTIFVHHAFEPYMYLLEKLPDSPSRSQSLSE